MIKNKFTFLIKSIVFLTAVFITSSANCQNEKLSETITNIAEELAADDSDPEAATLFIEQLHELSENPVSINSGDESELSRLFFLSDFQIKAIIDHTKKSGYIVSFYEIASIPGFDRQITEMIIPFISLVNRENNIPGKLKLRNTLISNFIVKPGECDTSSPGSPWKVLSKYKIMAGPFSGGMMLEKDAGERFLSGSPPIPDFLSSYISYTGKGTIHKMIIGDYSARFGQGTNINTRMRTGPSLTAPGYLTGRNEIRPYTSSDEYNFFRGAAVELTMKKLDLSLFYSNNKIDATIGSSADSTGLYVENFYNTGLHNNSTFMLKKDVVAETLYGINISYNLSSVRFGLTWSESRFSLPVNLKNGNPENLYGFEGQKNGVYSAYYNSLIKRIILYGEVSTNDPLNIAFVQGIIFRPSDRLAINFLYRNYSPEFISFHGRGQGSGSSTRNEHGVLGNFTFEAAKHLFISAGCDISYFPWLKYRCSFPSMAKKQEIKLKYIPGENLCIEASYNFRFSMVDMQDDQGITGIEEITVRLFKGIVKYSPAENFILATRIDYKVADESGSKGMLILQDINYRFHRIPVSFWFRYCIFNTDDWNSRLYTYENDLMYNFNIPALSGKGSRSYLMAEWEIGDLAELRFKYSLTTILSSDYIIDESDDIKLQFRVWF